MHNDGKLLACCVVLSPSPEFGSDEAVSYARSSLEQSNELAMALAQVQGWPVIRADIDNAIASGQAEFYLQLTQEGWLAYWSAEPKWRGLQFDYHSKQFLRRLRHAGGRSEGLIKALGRIAPEVIVDCTAGTGQESLLLATTGAKVIALERDPVVHLLLSDALKRASTVPELEPLISQVTLLNKEALQYLSGGVDANAIDVLYFDPMFPARNKKALVSKTMQFFQAVLSSGSLNNERYDVLLERALSIAKKKVIVKRPLRAPALIESPKPHQQVACSKMIRFDVYLPTN